MLVFFVSSIVVECVRVRNDMLQLQFHNSTTKRYQGKGNVFFLYFFLRKKKLILKRNQSTEYGNEIKKQQK